MSLAHRASGSATLADARKGSRRVYHYEMQDYVDTPVYDHDRLIPGAVIDGPVIIEQRASTAVAGPGDKVSVDAYLNLMIEIAPAAAAQTAAKGA